MLQKYAQQKERILLGRSISRQIRKQPEGRKSKQCVLVFKSDSHWQIHKVALQ